MGRPRKNPEEVEATDPVAATEAETTPEVSEKEPEVAATEPEEEVSGKEVTVLSEVGAVIRVYSAKVHGKGFRKLAEQFISDRKGYSLK